jgi:hypothetical protein
MPGILKQRGATLMHSLGIMLMHQLCMCLDCCMQAAALARKGTCKVMILASGDEPDMPPMPDMAPKPGKVEGMCEWTQHNCIACRTAAVVGTDEQ